MKWPVIKLDTFNGWGWIRDKSGIMEPFMAPCDPQWQLYIRPHELNFENEFQQELDKQVSSLN